MLSIGYCFFKPMAKSPATSQTVAPAKPQSNRVSSENPKRWKPWKNIARNVITSTKPNARRRKREFSWESLTRLRTSRGTGGVFLWETLWSGIRSDLRLSSDISDCFLNGETWAVGLRSNFHKQLKTSVIHCIACPTSLLFISSNQFFVYFVYENPQFSVTGSDLHTANLVCS